MRRPSKRAVAVGVRLQRHQRRLTAVAYRRLRAVLRKNRSRILALALAEARSQVGKEWARVEKKRDRFIWFVIQLLARPAKTLAQLIVGEGLEVTLESLGADSDILGDLDEPKRTVSQVGKRALRLVDQSGLRLAKSVAESLKGTVNRTIREGLDQQEGIAGLKKRLGKELKDFEEYKLERLARTESSMALNEASYLGYEESGVVEKTIWISDADPCPICLGNTGKPVKLGAKFPSGHTHPPAHPNCECTGAPDF